MRHSSGSRTLEKKEVTLDRAIARASIFNDLRCVAICQSMSEDQRYAVVVVLDFLTTPARQHCSTIRGGTLRCTTGSVIVIDTHSTRQSCRTAAYNPGEECN